MNVIKYLKDLISNFIKSLFNRNKDITRDGDENDVQYHDSMAQRMVGKPKKQKGAIYDVGKDPDDDEEGDCDMDIDDYYYNDQSSQGEEW